MSRRSHLDVENDQVDTPPIAVPRNTANPLGAHYDPIGQNLYYAQKLAYRCYDYRRQFNNGKDIGETRKEHRHWINSHRDFLDHTRELQILGRAVSITAEVNRLVKRSS